MKKVKKKKTRKDVFTAVKNLCMLHVRVFVMKIEMNARQLYCNVVIGTQGSLYQRLLSSKVGSKKQNVVWKMGPNT